MKRSFVFVALFLLTLSVCKVAVAAPADVWISVQSKNFHLIGNASEKNIRAVATRLEQFRETFRLLFPGMKIASSTPTTVIVFKSAAAYRPFKPKRPDGKPDDGIAGYFQSGDDVNYITLSTEGETEDTFGTIFHEYTHFMLDTSIGKANIPPWFNEGLAEYYQTYKIEEDQKVTLGIVQSGHLNLLQQTKLIPLNQFFAIDNYSLHANGDHSRSIFYAQAWVLMHYLIQGNGGNNVKSLERFLSLVLRDVAPESAFKQAFNSDYATMERELTDYIRKNKYTASLFPLKNKLMFDAEMTVAPISEAMTTSYLGDLLVHTQQYNDAEIQLKQALAAEPDSVMANTSMGLVKMKQRNFPEAKRFLERAIALDGKSAFAHYNYAFALSREGLDEFGYAQNYTPETAAKMRASLAKAIELNPQFPESYRLLGFVSLVTGDDLDNALKLVNRGLAVQPGDPGLMLVAAKIMFRQEKFDAARSLAEKVAKSTEKKETKADAEEVIATIERTLDAKAAYEKQVADARAQYEANALKLNLATSKPPKFLKRKDVTDEQMKQIERNRMNVGINSVLPPVETGQIRALGRVDKITCRNGTIRVSFTSADGPMTLSAVDFQSLQLGIFKEGTENFEVGCGSDLSKESAVATYTQPPRPVPGVAGQLVGLSIVPAEFRLMSQKEIADHQMVIVEGGPPTDIDKNVKAVSDQQTEFEQRRREAMMRQLQQALREPRDGETRFVGTIEKVECSPQAMSVSVNSDKGPMKLKIGAPNDLHLMVMTPDAAGVRFGCNESFPGLKAVITYFASTDKKPKYAGDLRSVEFVPASFSLP